MKWCNDLFNVHSNAKIGIIHDMYHENVQLKVYMLENNDKHKETFLDDMYTQNFQTWCNDPGIWEIHVFPSFQAVNFLKLSSSRQGFWNGFCNHLVYYMIIR